MIRTIILVIVAATQLAATTLTGSIKLPNGTGASGYMYLSLSQQAALSDAGGCGGPIQVIPTIQTKIQVVNGAMQSPPSMYGNDCLLPQGTYYNMTFKDNQGNTIFTDRWLIQGSSQDIGAIVSVVITGTTQTLGGVGVLLTVPTGNQTITQPPSTKTNFNHLGVTTDLLLPDGTTCGATGCTFGGTVGFTNGLNTGLVSPSVVFIGTGNFYTRTFSGAAVCTGVLDGWLGIRTDTHDLVVCIGGVAKKVTLQ